MPYNLFIELKIKVIILFQYISMAITVAFIKPLISVHFNFFHCEIMSSFIFARMAL